VTFNSPPLSADSAWSEMLDKFDLMNDLRAAVIRMNIEMVQVNKIVLALRHDLITCAQAFEWLETGGLLQYLSAEVGS
jgi:hypothetical protein